MAPPAGPARPESPLFPETTSAAGMGSVDMGCLNHELNKCRAGGRRRNRNAEDVICDQDFDAVIVQLLP